MYMLLIASPVINICSTVAWCRPYPRWYFTIFYFQCFPLAGLRLRFFWYVFPQDRQLIGCFFGRWFLIIPCSFSFCSDLAARSGCSFSLQVCSLLATHLPLRQVFFWPALLTPRYPVSGTPLPLRHDFFWPAILTPRSPFSGTPGPSFRSLFWCPWSSVSTPSFFPTQPFFPGYLGGRLAPCAALRYACGFYRSAVFTAPWFFTAPLSPVFWGLCSSAALMLAAPQSSPTSGRLALCAALRFACDFYRSVVFTAPRFLPLRGFYRSAFAGFLGALLFRRPHACCPPVFTHFRAARSLCRLAVRLRFLPLRGFYRSAVFTAPRFLPLRFRRFFGDSALPPPSCLLPPSLRPLPGAPCGAGSSVASPVGRHSWPFFCTACLTALGALPLISPVSLLCISYTLRDRRSSRLLSVGTRAPRVLPPPSGTSRRMEIRHFHHRLTEVPSVDMLIEAWNGSIYRWHGVSLWCGFLHVPHIHAPPVPETRSSSIELLCSLPALYRLAYNTIEYNIYDSGKNINV